MDGITFTWEIKEFDMCPHLSGKCLNSPTFSIDCLKTTTFGLVLFPRGDKKEDADNFVSLHLKRHIDNGKDAIYLEYEMFLMDASGNCRSVVKSKRLFPKDVSCCIFTFYKRILLHSVRHIFLPKNKLTIKCRIAVLEHNGDQNENVPSPEDYEQLSCDFGKLLNDEIHSDMTIVGGGEEFRVHRGILENRCPKMVEQLVKVEDSSVYSLTSIEAPVLLSILNYLYAGVHCDNNSILDKICIAANTYALPGLKSSLLPHIESITATTQIKVLQSVFKWEIEDFNSPQSNKEVVFPLISDEIPKWSWMKISLFKTPSDADHSCVLNIQRVYGEEIAFVHCEFKIPDGRGELRVLKECGHTFEHELKWETPIDFKVACVDGILPEGAIRLHVKIRVSSDKQYTEIKEVMYDTVFQKRTACIESSALQTDLQNVYKHMSHADVTLCCGTDQLPAHKSVLCCRSEVFAKMFLHETLEKQIDVVDIKDIDVQTMSSMLMYMYCGAIEGRMDVHKAIPIYAASDKYRVLVLREKCGRYLKSNLNSDNVGDILILADEHCDEGLKKCAFDFISSNPEEILNSKRGLKVLEEKKYLYAEIVTSLLRNGVEKNGRSKNT